MSEEKTSSRTRERGFSASSNMLTKLQEARKFLKWTYTELSKQSGIPGHTVRRFLSQQQRIEPKYAKAIVEALGFNWDDIISHLLKPELAEFQQTGQLPLESRIYIDRRADQELRNVFEQNRGNEENALVAIRLRAPKGMGKSSILIRLGDFLEKQGHIVGLVNLASNNIDRSHLESLDSLLKTFTYAVCQAFIPALKAVNYQPCSLNEYWDRQLGVGVKCRDYLKNEIFLPLQQRKQPITLLLDGIDRLSENTNKEQTSRYVDFTEILRSFYETQMKHVVSSEKVIWANMVLVYSTEPYFVFNEPAGSPLQNVGTPVELSSLNHEQVKKQAEKCNLVLSDAQITKIQEWIGGHPALLNSVLFYLAKQDEHKRRAENLDQTFMDLMHDINGLRGDLIRLRQKLAQDPKMEKCFITILSGEQSRDEIELFRLEKLGLICREEGKYIASFKLYQKYFEEVL